MDRDQRARLAKGLASNELLRVLFDERLDELRELWGETEPKAAEARERLHAEFHATRELRDSIYAKLAEYGGSAEID